MPADHPERAPLVVCYQPAITAEELWRQDQLEYAQVAARQQGLIRFLTSREAGER
jgi:hypothetical protein